MRYSPKVIFFFIVFFSVEVHAQNAYDSSLADAISLYKKTVGANIHLYSGSEYIDYDHSIAGNPYFNALYFTTGSVVYDGFAYNDVQIIYDILHDDVVIKNYNDTPLVLVKEKVSAFSCNGHNFINLDTDTSLNNFKISGFYDVLCDGETKLLAKRKKEIFEHSTTVYSESHYDETDNYYILKNNSLYAVNSKNSVLSVLKDRKSEVIKNMHQSKINFRKNHEAAMFNMVEYYNTLTGTK